MAISNPYPIETLHSRGVIELRGDGILPFLHNILTCSVDNLNHGDLTYGALLSPQGKILHDVFIYNNVGSVFLDCAATGRDELITKLKLYRLRAKFEILPRDDLYVQVGADVTADPRLAGLGGRRIVSAVTQGGSAQYEMRRYALGIADSSEIGSGKLFPHEANFDLMNAVDFNKGCYIGQEVVSRMQHRGTLKSRILPVTFENDPLTDDNRVVEILGRIGNKGLALVRLDRWVEQGAPLGLRILKPDWIKL